MCYGVSGQVLLGFPTGNPAIERLGYWLLEERGAQLLTTTVRTVRPSLDQALDREVGLITVPHGAEQATIAELERELVYRGMQLFDHEPDLRAPLVEGFHPTSPPPFFIEPNAAMSFGQGNAAPGAGFVLDATHDAMAIANLGFANARSTGSGVRVAVLDSGVEATRRPGVVVDELNVMEWDDPQLKSDVSDGHGHGTHMASIIARHAPQADYVIVKVADDTGCTTTWHVMAGLATVPDCQVINVSIASSPQATQFACAPMSDELVSANLAAVVRDVSSRDAVVVAAAGNKALAHLAYPARVGDCVAIASVNSNLDLSSFSNHGVVDHAGNPHHAVFVAPGGDEQDPHGAVTEQVGTDSATGAQPYFGTSYATAYATAAVALFRADNPGHDRSQTIAALTSSADNAFAGYNQQKHGNGLLRLP